jgi:hypothetical protein
MSTNRSHRNELPSLLKTPPLPRQYHDLLTVFQAEPLVVRDLDGTLNSIGCLDFESEQEMLEIALNDSPISIELVFDIATTERLSAFENHALFLSWA